MKRDQRSSVPSNLPLALDAFVGRADDLRRVGELLATSRLVTVTGGPGMGKTRLATETARASVDGCPDGVWLVALAPVGDTDLVVPALTTLLSAPQPSKRGAHGGLVARIDDQRMLLVLDNCEHVLEVCAQLAAALLEACPNLTILATSQERLGVTGEHAWPLSGLAVTDDTKAGSDLVSDSGAATVASHGDAVRLFGERARAAAPDFVLDDTNAHALVDICLRLDGIPLAIELAAARVVTFTPEEIARHLDDRFAFLTAGKRATLARHQTLRAAVDWSYDLLHDKEQTLLRRLSIFAGGATLDAIEQVCTDDAVSGDECLDLMTTLVSRSLVVARTTDHGTRYGLLETIRFYGKDRLAEAGEVTRLATRHVRWCVALAEEAEPHLTGPNQQDWLSRLEVEHDNLRAAMAWSLDQGPTDEALRIAGALTMFWRLRSHYLEGSEWLDRVLDVSDNASAVMRAKAHWGQALLNLMLGFLDHAVPGARRSLELASEVDDPRGTARSLLLLGSMPVPGRDTNGEIADLQHAIALTAQVGDSWCLAQALALCGSAFAQLGEVSTAGPILEQSVSVARSAGDQQSLSFGLLCLGHFLVAQGDYPGAEGLLEEVLTLADSGDTYERVSALTGLAMVNTGRGDLGRARRLLADAASNSIDISSFHSTVDVTVAAARLALTEGDIQSAGDQFSLAESRALAMGNTSRSAIQGMGEAALAIGDRVYARRFLTEALDMSTASGHKGGMADALYSLGELSRLDGEQGMAVSLNHQALNLRADIADLPGLASSIEALAKLAITAEHFDKPARAFAAAHALRQAKGYARPAPAQAAYEAAMARAREALGDEQFDAAWAEGLSMSAPTAVSYLAKRRGRRTKRPVRGPAALTAAERQVANLAVQGFSNGDIARQLFVSVPTVKTHLSRVYTKMSVSSRSELMSRFADEGL